MDTVFWPVQLFPHGFRQRISGPVLNRSGCQYLEEYSYKDKEDDMSINPTPWTPWDPWDPPYAPLGKGLRGMIRAITSTCGPSSILILAL